MACNCAALNLNDSCGRCKSCRKIESGSHPDIILVKPSGHSIRIDQIRNLCHTLTMKPYEARMRVVIIPDAQTMNPEAGNAILKILEEPPDRTILILTAIQRSDLLPTIVSRCQQIKFKPISRKKLMDMLVEKHGLGSDDALIIANMAKGSFSKAVSMAVNRTDWINRRDWLINTVGMDRPEPLSLQPIGLLLAFAAELSKKREILQDSLEVIKSYLRDIVIYKYYPEKIINKDLTSKIRYASQKIGVKPLLSKIEAIGTAQKDIEANTNLRLTLEVLAVRLAGADNQLGEEPIYGKSSWNKT